MFSRTVKSTEAMIETAIMARQLGRNTSMLVSFRQWIQLGKKTRPTPTARRWPMRAELLRDQAT